MLLLIKYIKLNIHVNKKKCDDLDMVMTMVYIELMGSCQLGNFGRGCYLALGA